MTDPIDLDARPLLTETVPVRFRRGENGRPVMEPADPSRWLSMLARILGKAESVEATATFSRAKRTRSLAANAYLWAVVYPDILEGLRRVAQDAGERCPFADVEELHEAMKYVLLGVEVLRVGGVTVERPSTTRVMDSTSFSLFVSGVKRLAAERWSIYVREPGESLAV